MTPKKITTVRMGTENIAVYFDDTLIINGPTKEVTVDAVYRALGVESSTVIKCPDIIPTPKSLARLIDKIYEINEILRRLPAPAPEPKRRRRRVKPA